MNRTAQQATSRTIFAISRDHGLPDRGFFGHITKKTQTPLRAVLLATILSELGPFFAVIKKIRSYAMIVNGLLISVPGILPGFLALASKYASGAIFAMTTVGTFIYSPFTFLW
jgi:amino acid transporter